MKKPVFRTTPLAATFVVIALTPAWPQAAPSPSDAHPPGAIFLSTPSGAEADDPQGNMINPPVDLRVKPKAAESMQSRSAGLSTRQRRARGRAGGPEDSNTAPIR